MVCRTGCRTLPLAVPPPRLACSDSRTQTNSCVPRRRPTPLADRMAERDVSRIETHTQENRANALHGTRAKRKTKHLPSSALRHRRNNPAKERERERERNTPSRLATDVKDGRNQTSHVTISVPNSAWYVCTHHCDSIDTMDSDTVVSLLLCSLLIDKHRWCIEVH